MTSAWVGFLTAAAGAFAGIAIPSMVLVWRLSSTLTTLVVTQADHAKDLQAHETKIEANSVRISALEVRPSRGW